MDCNGKIHTSRLFSIFAMSALMSLKCSLAMALPFNSDMVSSKNAEGRHMYFATGEIMRARPEGSISIGMSDYQVKTKEDAEKLVNPKKDDKKSWKFGKRLFQVNCSPCHGNIESTTYEKDGRGPVAQKFAAPPNISVEPYLTGRTDGSIYGTIHFGNLGIMPALGWKLSPGEHWDIVNYIRHVQQVKLEADKSATQK